MKVLRRCFLFLMLLFFLFFVNSTGFAEQKYTLKTSEKLSNKLSLGKLLHTCSGLKIVPSRSAPEPFSLNAEKPREKCHWEDRDGPGGDPAQCVSGAGYFSCPCDDMIP